MSKPNGKGVGGFVKLDHALLRSPEWQGLSVGARALLIDIWAEHNGKNNGAIRYSVRQAETALRCSRRTALYWFKELQAARLIEAVERGGFRWKAGACEGRATAWRIIPQHSKGAH